MSLYLDYRPSTLEEIVGNEEIVDTLSKMLLKPKKFPHTLMFSGPTGCGKTTFARIIADRLGCAPGDFKEINSAEVRGIDGVREIIKQSAYLPFNGGPCSIWLLDEIHKTTGEAQNALLKILEDTPSHVYFILCTTEPNKVIAAVKGRCQHFQVKTLSEEKMMTLLKSIAKAEGEKITGDLKLVLQQIIDDSLGHPRNAIQVLEQTLLAEPDKRMAVAKRIAEQQSQIIELCRILMKPGRWKEVAFILSGLKEEDCESIRRMVMGYCQAILLKGQESNQAAKILEAFMEPNFTNGFPQLTLACYTVIKGE